MAIYISIYDKRHKNVETVLLKGRKSLGRSRSCHIPIKDTFLSGHHCDIRLDGNFVIVKDMGSKNGVFINGNKITEDYLYLGDELNVGHQIIKLEPEHMSRLELETCTYGDSVPSRYVAPEVTIGLDDDVEFGGISKVFKKKTIAGKPKKADQSNFLSRIIKKIKD